MNWFAAAPGLAQFRGYQRSFLRGDVVAGLTVAAYLVPQVMAYATVAGLSPVVGPGQRWRRWPCTPCWDRPGSCRRDRSRRPR